MKCFIHTHFNSPLFKYFNNKMHDFIQNRRERETDKETDNIFFHLPQHFLDIFKYFFFSFFFSSSLFLLHQRSVFSVIVDYYLLILFNNFFSSFPFLSLTATTIARHYTAVTSCNLCPRF